MPSLRIPPHFDLTNCFNEFQRGRTSGFDEPRSVFDAVKTQSKKVSASFCDRRCKWVHRYTPETKEQSK